SDERESKKLFTAQADLTAEADVRSFVALVQKQFGAVDCLINLAGGYAGGNTIAEVSLDEWESMMSLNLRTTFLMCREVLKSMLARKAGRIINISAMPAILSGAKKGPYAISKRAVISLTEIIADEVKGSGITANAIAPSIILTDANKTSMPAADVQKWVTPEEIAGVILFLCSDEARSINGNTIKVFGGV
ncbi:MAG: SDR family oxidoreductase, partial [bacterium]